MGEQVYLRPVGIVFGRIAAQAIEAGLALPLAGGPAAFLAAELIEGTPGNTKKAIARVATLKAMEEPVIARQLDTLSAPRPAIAGVPMDRPRLMGVVNVTPDSFSDGGEFASSEEAVSHAKRLREEGADFIDIGGESTRPGSDPVPLDEELVRILPVIRQLAGTSIPLSVDTRKSRTMREAASAGAAIINDVSALSYDPESLQTAAALGLPVVLMHAKGDPKTMQDHPAYTDVLLEVFDFLAERIAAATAAGIPKEKIVADPGIGFGKTLAHNLALLEGLSVFHGLGVPIMVGASRKSFIGKIAGEPEPKRRVPGSLAAAIAAAEQGAQILRVHDVGETRQALSVWRAATCGQVM